MAIIDHAALREPVFQRQDIVSGLELVAAFGGAVGAMGEDDTAFSHRHAQVDFLALGRWTDPADDELLDPGNLFRRNANIPPSPSHPAAPAR
jgi:hypothetical protein